MAYESGTSSGFKDLLSKLKTFTEANGWTTRDYSVGGSINVADELYIEGPGSTPTEKVYINITTRANNTLNQYAWQLYGATDYSSSLTVGNQPNSSPGSFLRIGNTTLSYKFFINDRRIIVSISTAGTRRMAYLGFFLPLANPVQYPYPLLIAGCSRNLAAVSSTSDSACFFYPKQFTAHIMETNFTWSQLGNQAITGSTFVNPKPKFCTHPYSPNGLTNFGFNNYDGSLSYFQLIPPANDADAIVLFPINLISRVTNSGYKGVFDGVYYISGFNQTDGNTAVIDSETYHIFNSITDVTFDKFCAVKEDV